MPKKVLVGGIVAIIVVAIAIAVIVNLTVDDDVAEEAEPDFPLEIEMWIGLGGELGEEIERMASVFNDQQDNYIINVIEQGDYAEAMTSAIAAYRAGDQPHILQVYEVGTGTMMGNQEVIYPVYQLMEDYGRPFDTDDVLEQVTSYYSDLDGNMLSFPFNSSTPIFYYNVDAFEEAGLDPDQPPETWHEVEEYARALVDTGNHTAGLSFQWPSWTNMENFSAWHDVPFGTRANGLDGWDAELVVNGEAQVAHLSALAEWADEGLYQYGGRGGDAGPLFNSGDVPMYIGSSAAYAGIAANADFEFNASYLPYWPEIVDSPQNSIIGGGSLWVMDGHTDAEYEGIAEFFDYLSSPEVQAEWHQFSGYLPVTNPAWELTREAGFYDEVPIHNTAIEQITLNEPTDNSRGLRFGSYVQVRDEILTAMEAAISGDTSAQAALDQAVERGNALLREFEQTVIR